MGTFHQGFWWEMNTNLVLMLGLGSPKDSSSFQEHGKHNNGLAIYCFPGPIEVSAATYLENHPKVPSSRLKSLSILIGMQTVILSV